MESQPYASSRFPHLEPEGPPQRMTEEQKFVFDLKGWLLVPAVLSEVQLCSIRAHVEALHADREGVPAEDRHSLAGPAQILLDHPAITGILEELLGHNRPNGAYGFRCEGSFSTIRHAGYDKVTAPHGGGNNVSPLFSYQCKNGSMYSALTRVVWELNEVPPGAGATLLLSGSHKMNFPLPPGLTRESPLFESYTCPPGSVLIFSEAVTHSGDIWRCTTHPRMAIFNAYSRIDTQYHKMTLAPEIPAAMPERRRTLFRGVWSHDFTAGRGNDYYAPDNHAW
jgi:ectoine hydroxylase-related dioxygenase (phytanoyl-CoA dioxygenase family)